MSRSVSDADESVWFEEVSLNVIPRGPVPTANCKRVPLAKLRDRRSWWLDCVDAVALYGTAYPLRGALVFQLPADK